MNEFIMLPPPPHLVTVVSVPGSILHKDSEEAKIQLAGGLVGTIQKIKDDLLGIIINLIIA